VLSAVLALLFAAIPEREANGLPHLRSESVLVRDAETKEVLLSKNPLVVRPIASVTKLLSALVLERLDSETSTRAFVTILEEDKDRVKWSKSRIHIGRAFERRALLDAALIASDNRAMYACVRAQGIARAAFVEKMNALARELGMEKSEFKDPAGIDPGNVSTAADLLLLLDAASNSARIRDATKLGMLELVDTASQALTLYSPNRLARSSRWELVVAKTGYTVEAGRALALRTRIDGRTVDMVFLGAREMASVFGDAGRVRRWLGDRAKVRALTGGPAPAPIQSIR
jgi:D-alanyl-D-alanine endopeptidase (penicillin-binding protein 7)